MSASLVAPSDDAPARPTRGRHAAAASGDDEIGLYTWQREALTAWAAAGQCGVVEAVTGSGKTRVAIAAIAYAVAEQRHVVVLVPTVELQRQWTDELNRWLPGVRVGGVGGGRDDGFTGGVRVLVALVHSASRRQLTRPGHAALLVADECHRYAAETFSRALHPAYTSRLGLTATYERDDGAHERYLDGYFGRVVYRLWYDRALREKVIAPFDVALVGVELSRAERATYDEHSDGLDHAARRLCGLSPELRELSSVEFLKAVSQLAVLDDGDQVTLAARAYMFHYSRRRGLLADTAAKYRLLTELAPVIAAAHGSLVFTQTQQSARQATETLAALGIATTAVYSGLDSSERHERMADFRAGAVRMLAAPRVLDEGVDVPEADLAVIVAANRSRRQLVQRLGRVVRRKYDGRPGRLVVLYAADTVEDPDVAGDEHLRAVLPHARNVEYFTAPRDAVALRQFLYRCSEDRDPPSPDIDQALSAYRPRHAAPDMPAPNVAPRSPVDLPWEAIPTAPSAELPRRRRPGLIYDPHPEPVRPEAVKAPDSLRRYLKQIGGVALLTAEQEVDLAKRVEAGVYAAERLREAEENGEKLATQMRRDLRRIVRDGERCRNHLLEANLRLVVGIARRHRGRGLEFLDLIQEGNLGLIRAVEKYDWTSGYRFSTYATWWIRQAITRAVADKGRCIRLPVHLVEVVNRLDRIDRELVQDLGRRPTAAELAKELDVTPAQVLKLQLDAQPAISLDELLDQGVDVEDPEADAAHEAVTFTLLQDQLQWVLQTLPEREAGVIKLRFGLTDGQPRTLEEIGQVYGLTRERIRQIEVKTMATLRHPSRSQFLRDYLD